MLDGELHVKTYENGELTDTAVRHAGDYAKKPAGDVHMEQGGPDGALVLFELYAPDGQLTEQLDPARQPSAHTHNGCATTLQKSSKPLPKSPR